MVQTRDRLRLPVLVDVPLPPSEPDPPSVEVPGLLGRLTVRQAEKIAGTLGHPSKMPGFSYGISAVHCKTGGELRRVPGSVCSACYAMTDWYRSWIPLLVGHARRLRGLRHPRWVDAMVKLISTKCVGDNAFFRWHDSGDLQGIWHLNRIARIATRTPKITHWLPTREYGLVRAFLANGTAIPDNLTIRLSAHMIDAEPVLPPELVGMPTSTVSTVSQYARGGARVVEEKGSVECRAVEARENKCGACRACWSRDVSNVSYPQH